jgi:long-subunit acyl-CoA synthetase (AMP-forming)
LEQAILDFAEGLRVIGVRPDEKLALFADNSYRWLVADQGVSISFFFIFSTFSVLSLGIASCINLTTRVKEV